MRKPPAKTRETHLMAWWDEKEKDVTFSWPDQKANGHYLYWIFSRPQLRRKMDNGNWSGRLYDAVEEDPSFLEELDRRGFDITTIRFSIKKKEKKDHDIVS